MGTYRQPCKIHLAEVNRHTENECAKISRPILVNYLHWTLAFERGVDLDQSPERHVFEIW